LTAAIVSLTIPLGGIVAFPKQLQQIAEIDYFGIPYHSHHFGMASAATTNCVVTRKWGNPSGVTNGGRYHPWQSPKPFLCSPEASTTKDCFSFVGASWSIDAATKNEVFV
jgi:hypothetical protein